MRIIRAGLRAGSPTSYSGLLTVTSKLVCAPDSTSSRPSDSIWSRPSVRPPLTSTDAVPAASTARVTNAAKPFASSGSVPAEAVGRPDAEVRAGSSWDRMTAKPTPPATTTPTTAAATVGSQRGARRPRGSVRVSAVQRAVRASSAGVEAAASRPSTRVSSSGADVSSRPARISRAVGLAAGSLAVQRTRRRRSAPPILPRSGSPVTTRCITSGSES
ncbi:hypothetical protein [Actinocorallia aurea]